MLLAIRSATRALVSASLSRRHGLSQELGVRDYDAQEPPSRSHDSMAGRSSIAFWTNLPAYRTQEWTDHERRTDTGDRAQRRSHSCPARASLEDGYSAHSLRSGFMTEAATQGIALPEAMKLSDHKAVPSALRYYDVKDVLDSPAASLIDSTRRPRTKKKSC